MRGRLPRRRAPRLGRAGGGGPSDALQFRIGTGGVQMRGRLSTLLGALVAALALGVTLAAQGPARWTPPRTADGHPDLQGTYDVATITPVERPAQFKSLNLSREEAAKLEGAEAARDEKLRLPS